MKLKIGISTCPNDTYLFHALLTEQIIDPDIQLEFSLLDIEELNQNTLDQTLDISKVSFALVPKILDHYSILDSGAALGFGVGPIVVGLSGTKLNSESKILCPGINTTATLLSNRYLPNNKNIGQCLFSEITPAVLSGKADAGVLIHEGRFTYKSLGLELLIDLGALWEEETKLPLPLGGLVAKNTLSPEVRDKFCTLVRQAFDYSKNNPAHALESMRKYAQEFEDSALWKHVELYVNQKTYALGPEGLAAIDRLIGV